MISIKHPILALTGRPPRSRHKRALLVLRVRHGGVGITNRTTNSVTTFQAFEHLTAPITAVVFAQDLAL